MRTCKTRGICSAARQRYDLHLPLTEEATEELRCLRELVRQRPEICLLVELPQRHPGEYLKSLAVLKAAVGG